MRRTQSSFHFGAKLIALLLLATIGGLVWAMLETGRSPADLLRLFGGADSEVPKPEAKKETPAPRSPSTPVAHTPVKPADPVPRDPPPIEAPRPLSDAQMESLALDVEGRLRKGEILAVRDSIAQMERTRIPASQAQRFRQLEERVEAYARLLRETTPGAVVPMPEMAELLTMNGSRMMVIRDLVETPDAVTFETLSGIRSRLAKTQVRELTRMTDPYRKGAALDYELRCLCQQRGVRMSTSPSGVVFTAEPKVTGLVFFDLADFCARNGHVVRIVPLFDEALRRDASIFESVHEAKAERMVQVFFYFLSLHAREDARTVYQHLRSHYRDTRTYREKVEGDPDIVEGYRSLTGDTIAKAEPRSVPSVEPKPGSEPPSQASRVDPPRAESTEPSGENVSRTTLPPGTSETIVRLVKKGDEAFEQAMKHLRASDPNLNPEGWVAENKEALDSFIQAFECYEQAQEEYEKLGQKPPAALLKRFRDTTMSRSLCRKRAVSSR